MKASNLCYSLIRHFEGCKLLSYKDAIGIYTIGYGNTFYADGRPVKRGDVITQKQADELLPKIVEKFAISVDKAIKVEGVLQQEFDAMVCLTYNIGIGNFEQSTLLRLVNRNMEPEEIAAEFLRWNKAKGQVLAGLTRRRKAEAHLYLTGEIKTEF